jgi:DNA repair exonuclease SbcCD nuclease subunit
MRLLLFSDLHLDVPHLSLPAAEANAALAEARRTFLAICKLAQLLQVDAVCAAGNLYDQSSATQSTGHFLREGFADIDPIPVLLAPGSTDWYHSTSQYDDVRWSDNVIVFREARLAPVTFSDGGTVWGAAHTQRVEDGFLSTLPAPDEWPAGPHVALFHGCEQTDAEHEHATGLHRGPASAPFRRDDIHASGLAHALVGHLTIPRDTRLGVLPAFEPYTYAGRATPGHGGLPRYGGPVLVTIHEDGRVEEEWFDVAPPVAGPPADESIVDDWIDPEPDWVREILDGPGPAELPDPDRLTVLARFVRDVDDTNPLADLRRAQILRAGLHGWRDNAGLESGEI